MTDKNKMSTIEHLLSSVPHDRQVRGVRYTDTGTNEQARQDRMFEKMRLIIDNDAALHAVRGSISGRGMLARALLQEHIEDTLLAASEEMVQDSLPVAARIRRYMTRKYTEEQKNNE